MSELIQLKFKDIPSIRQELTIAQNYKCKLSGQPIELDEKGLVLDHQHKFKYQENGVDGHGLVRGVLTSDMNLMEGKIWNAMTEFLRPKCVDERIEMLEKLITFYKSGTTNYIHPKEEPKAKTVSKRNYNLLKKVYNGKKKFPEYPKSKKLTKFLSELFTMYDIEPYN